MNVELSAAKFVISCMCREHIVKYYRVIFLDIETGFI